MISHKEIRVLFNIQKSHLFDIYTYETIGNTNIRIENLTQVMILIETCSEALIQVRLENEIEIPFESTTNRNFIHQLAAEVCTKAKYNSIKKDNKIIQSATILYVFYGIARA